jgi:hypothetical protein
MGAMALHGYSSMELRSRSFTSKEPHVAREPQVADPCPSAVATLSIVTLLSARINSSTRCTVSSVAIQTGRPRRASSETFEFL